MPEPILIRHKLASSPGSFRQAGSHAPPDDSPFALPAALFPVPSLFLVRYDILLPIEFTSRYSGYFTERNGY